MPNDQKTSKFQTQSGASPLDLYWPLATSILALLPLAVRASDGLVSDAVSSHETCRRSSQTPHGPERSAGATGASRRTREARGGTATQSNLEQSLAPFRVGSVK